MAQQNGLLSLIGAAAFADGRPTRQSFMKWRFILPGIFLLGVILFVTANLIGAGHGTNTFDFVLHCAYPAAFLTDLLVSFLGGLDWLSFPLGVIAGLFQYLLFGYLIDKLLQRRRVN